METLNVRTAALPRFSQPGAFWQRASPGNRSRVGVQTREEFSASLTVL